MTAVGGAGIEPAVLGSQCRCAGEFACVWCPVWELTCQKLLLLTRPSDESCRDRFALETIYVALKQAQIITFLGQGRPMPKQERFAFIFRFFLRQAYYVALAGPDLYVDKASLEFREICLFLPPEFWNKRHLVARTSFLWEACQHICHLHCFTGCDTPLYFPVCPGGPRFINGYELITVICLLNLKRWYFRTSF